MPSRFKSRSIETNADISYKEHFEKRGVNFIHQFSSGALRYPSADELAELTIIGHVWVIGDRFYKLAHEHYGDPELWWVIAWYNQTPLESSVKLGDVVEIPFPLNRLLRMMEV